MYRLEPRDFIKAKYVSFWTLLAFQAGFINSIGFLACSRFVSHVTGYGSYVGIMLGQGNYWLALEMISAPLSFITGAWFSGILTVARSSRGLKPRYDLATLFLPLILGGLTFAGIEGVFGPFGEPLLLPRDFIFLSLLSFICGMQNACFATLTKGQIRTTHLTGISTDIGTDLALTINGGLPPDERQLAIGRNRMRLWTMLGFWSGALLSAVIAARMEYQSLLVPLVTSTIVSVIFFRVKWQIDHR